MSSVSEFSSQLKNYIDLTHRSTELKKQLKVVNDNLKKSQTYIIEKLKTTENGRVEAKKSNCYVSLVTSKSFKSPKNDDWINLMVRRGLGREEAQAIVDDVIASREKKEVDKLKLVPLKEKDEELSEDLVLESEEEEE